VIALVEIKQNYELRITIKQTKKFQFFFNKIFKKNKNKRKCLHGFVLFCLRDFSENEEGKGQRIH
jgi:hypothetical protein